VSTTHMPPARPISSPWRPGWSVYLLFRSNTLIGNHNRQGLQIST
jgi:hypothetical protein